MARTTTFYTQEQSVFDHSIWREKQRLKLSDEEMLVFLYLNHNEKIEITGLYEVNFWEMTIALSLDEEKALIIIKSLEERKMLVWDNNLVYVPTIKKRHNFIGRGGSDKYWKTKVRKALSYQYHDTINIDGTPNNAYLAFQNNNPKLIIDYWEEKNRTHQVSSDSPQSHQVSSDSPQSHQVSSDSPQSHQVSSDSPQSHQVSSDSPQSHQVSSDSPPTRAVSGDSS